MSISDRDFQDLRDQVNRVDQRQEEVVIRGLSDIKKTLNNLGFVAQKDFDTAQTAQSKVNTDVEERIVALEKITGSGALADLNTFWGKLKGILIGALVIGVILALGLGIFTLYPAIKATL